MTFLKGKRDQPQTLDEVLKRWWANVSLYSPGVEGLRLPYDQDVANERAAGLARLYAEQRTDS